MFEKSGGNIEVERGATRRKQDNKQDKRSNLLKRIDIVDCSEVRNVDLARAARSLFLVLDLMARI